MPRGRGLIRRGVGNFLTQTAQLHQKTFSEFGDTDLTTVITVKCLVYQASDEQVQSSPAVSRLREQRAIVSDAVTFVEKGDMLKAVVDAFGVTVLDEARIVEVMDFDHWSYGRRFRQLILSVDLDG